MKKIVIWLTVTALIIASLPVSLTVEAADGYNYSAEGKIIECSPGFVTTRDDIFGILSDAWKKGFGDDAKNKPEDFNSPQDMFLYRDPKGEETIYVVDSESNKLFVFDGSINYKKSIDSFPLSKKLIKKPDGTLNSEKLMKIKSEKKKLWTEETASEYKKGKVPKIICSELSGVYRRSRPARDENGDYTGSLEDIIYLCDKMNMQVLLLDAKTYEVVQVVTAPKASDLADKFNPIKIVSDVTGRMYIICEGTYEGILLMDYDGEFMRMVGVNFTSMSFLDSIKHNFKTEEQLKREKTILTTNYNNFTIDEKGFLYTVSSAVKKTDKKDNLSYLDTTGMIKRINQSNNDVLTQNGYAPVKGDLIFSTYGLNSGPSNFVAITVNDYGVYTAADSRQGRLFTYDKEGNLLYISGGRGAELTDIQNPVAIAYQGENLLVLDKKGKCIMRFKPTEFARKINAAVDYEFKGDRASAAKEWQKVIKLNPAYGLAYVGVGKKYYDEGRFEDAREYFELGNDKHNYSRAFKKQRDETIKKYFPVVLTAVIIIAGGLSIFKAVKKAKFKKPHPEDGDFL